MAGKLEEIVQFMKNINPECRSVKWEVLENGILILQEVPSTKNINEVIQKILKPPKYSKQKPNLNTAFYNIKHEPVFCFKSNIDASSTMFLCSQYYTEGVCMENYEVSFKVYSEKIPLLFYLGKPECSDQINEFFESRFDKNQPFVKILCRYKSFLSYFNVHEINDQIIIKPGTFYMYIASSYSLYAKNHQPQTEISHTSTLLLSPSKSKDLKNFPVENKVNYEAKISPKLVDLEKCHIRASISSPKKAVNSPRKIPSPVATLKVELVAPETMEMDTSSSSDDTTDSNVITSRSINLTREQPQSSKTRKVKNPYVKYSDYCKVLEENKVLKAKLREKNFKLTTVSKQQLKTRKF